MDVQATGNEISHLGPREVSQIRISKDSVAQAMDELEKIGVGFRRGALEGMYSAFQEAPEMLVGQAGMDTLLGTLTTASLATPVQFLQEWLPGFVFVITQVRMIDELVGITTQGSWEDEEIVQGILEHIGTPSVYGDQTNIPLASWNTNFETRTIVRMEQGLSVGRLEEARAAAMRVSSSQSKRIAAAQSLEISRNLIGFNGFDGGANQTFGFLNDPQLPAYVGSPGVAWNNVGATFASIQGDLRFAIQTLRTQSGGNISPGGDPLTLAVPLAAYDFLSLTSDFGNSVMQWLTQTYPNVRVIPVPQLDDASGGLGALYLYAEGADDESTDDRRTWVQVVPAKFQTLGVEQGAKMYVEDYTNATAGVLCKRPWAVFRMSGITE